MLGAADGLMFQNGEGNWNTVLDTRHISRTIPRATRANSTNIRSSGFLYALDPSSTPNVSYASNARDLH